MGEIQIAGDSWTIGAPVVQPTDLGGYGFKNLRARSVPPDLFLFHWDGCNSTTQTHRVLRRRGLSVDFLIDAAGAVYQLNPDPLKFWTQHAKGVNLRSVGVEIQNPVYPRRFRKDKVWRPVLDVWRPHHVLTAVDIDDKLAKVSVLGFTEPQIVSAIMLADRVCKALSIPWRLPRIFRAGDISASTAWWNPDTKHPESIAQTFTGVCGHYHTNLKKIDPAGLLWPAFEARGIG